MARLYHRVDRGEIDCGTAGRLCQILSTLLGSARDHEFDRRINEIEERLAKAKPNGHDRTEARL